MQTKNKDKKAQISTWFPIIILILIVVSYVGFELLEDKYNQKPQCDLWWCYKGNDVSNVYTEDCYQCVRYDIPVGWSYKQNDLLPNKSP